MATMNVADAAGNSAPILLRGTVPLNAQHTFNKVVTLTDVVTAAGYAAGDAIGGLATFNATSIEDGRICIRSIRMAVNSANLGSNNITCRVFGSAPATPTNDSAWTLIYNPDMRAMAGSVTLAPIVSGSAALYHWTGEIWMQPATNSVVAGMVATAASAIIGTAVERQIEIVGTIH